MSGESGWRYTNILVFDIGLFLRSTKHIGVKRQLQFVLVILVAANLGLTPFSDLARCLRRFLVYTLPQKLVSMCLKRYGMQLRS